MYRYINPNGVRVTTVTDVEPLSLEQLLLNADAALENRDLFWAFECTVEAKRRFPNNMEVQYRWGEMLMARELFREAQPVFAKLSRDNYKWSRLHYGWCLLIGGQALEGETDDDLEMIKAGLGTIVSGFDKAYTKDGPLDGPDVVLTALHLESLGYPEAAAAIRKIGDRPARQKPPPHHPGGRRRKRR